VEFVRSQLRQSLHRLIRTPMFTAMALLMLSLGIGASSAVFSVVECVLLKPLPYPHSEELVALEHSAPGWNVKDIGISASVYFIYTEQSRTFQDIGLYFDGINSSGYWANVTGLVEPEHVPTLSVNAGLLSVLRVTPLLGRAFTREDDSPGSAYTVMLTYGYWQRKFGGDGTVIGRTITVNGNASTIIGVLPQDFRFLNRTNLAILVPMKLNRTEAVLSYFTMQGMARLKPGATLAQASADAMGVLPMVERSFPPPKGFSVKLYQEGRIEPDFQPLEQKVVGDAGKGLWVLMGGTFLVLIIACANLAILLLVRVEGRQQELATRVALGASRRRIAAEVFFESLVLAVLGAVIGFGLAAGALRVLVTMAPPNLPRLGEIRIDGNVVLFTLAVSLASSLLFGCVPAFKYSGSAFRRAMRQGARSMSETRERHRARGALVIIQVALALVLLVSSGLMVRTFRALTRVDPGFVAPSEVETFTVDISNTEVKEPERVVRIQEAIEHKLEAIPGVRSVGLSRNIPMDGSIWHDGVYIKDRVDSQTMRPACRYEFVAPGFFKTLGTPIIAGRDLTWNDIYEKVPVVMVSEKFARENWQGSANALGKQVREGTGGEWREIIGVVGDVHQDGVDKKTTSSVYWPIFTAGFLLGEERRRVNFIMRTSRAGSEGFVDEVRRAVLSAAPTIPLAEVHTLKYYYNRSMARTSFMLVMLAVSSGIALVLSLVGLYSVVAYSVTQRKRVIGIHMALGAGKREILKMIISQGIKLALIGVAIGLGGSIMLMRFLSGLLYGVGSSDPATLVMVSTLLVAVSLFASYVPASQATKVEPTVALRYE
jgi:predicted permease